MTMRRVFLGLLVSAAFGLGSLPARAERLNIVLSEDYLQGNEPGAVRAEVRSLTRYIEVPVPVPRSEEAMPQDVRYGGFLIRPRFAVRGYAPAAAAAVRGCLEDLDRGDLQEAKANLEGQEGLVVESLKIFLESLPESPSDPPDPSSLGEAIRNLPQPSSDRPEAGFVGELRASLLEAAGENGSAARALRGVAETSEEDSSSGIWLRIARLELQDHDLDGASEAIGNHLASNPDEPDAWTMLSLVSLQRGEPEESIEAADRALEEDFTLVSAHLVRGMAYERERNLHAARSEYEVAVFLAEGRDGFPDDALESYRSHLENLRGLIRE